MKKQLLFFAFLALASAACTAQQPAKPVKTGNEWKMPGDVLQRSAAFANHLKTKLSLDSTQTTKVYNAFMANTKSVDEISLLPDEEQKKAKLKENKAAFSDILKGILTPAQFSKYLQLPAADK